MVGLSLVEAVARLLPGVLGDDESSRDESFSQGQLEYPQYTRPAEFRGMAVPEVLVNGNHEEIRRWRKRRALEKTLKNRPDLLDKVALSNQDQALIEEIGREMQETRRT